MTEIIGTLVLFICTCTAFIFIIDSLVRGKYMWTMAFLSLYVLNVAMYLQAMLH